MDTPLHKKKSRKFSFGIISSIVFFILLGILGWYLFSPVTVPADKRITIPEGYTVSQVAELLKNEKLLRSSYGLKILARINDISVKAGSYAFEFGTLGLGTVVARLERADYGDVYTTVTFPEGITRKKMAEILSSAELKNFTSQEFLDLTRGKEGYLFPDTYLFLPDSSSAEIVQNVEENFQKKTQELREGYHGKRSWSDIVTMASLIEKEASNDPQEQRIVAGILWKRIDRGIPLQVDAPFLVALGKGSHELRREDLYRDAVYNTYTRKGLPPAPIGNPGLAAIKAAAEPQESLYFFYLHDNNGVIHYGVTHDDHVRNKRQYLR